MAITILCPDTCTLIICKTCVQIEQRNYNKEEYSVNVKIKNEFMKHSFLSLQIKQYVFN